MDNNPPDKKSQEDILLSDEYDQWIDDLLDMSEDEQSQALEKLASSKPELANALKYSFQHNIFSTSHVHNILSANELQAGDQIGAWKLESILGKGGMGTVWRAQRADGEFDQTVAIKILYSAQSTQSTRERFERERQLLAGLRHPGIAALFDGGTTEHGHMWFVLEYVKGLSITQYCQDNHLSIDARLVLFSEVCAAVVYAHKTGVIHRDIKPANILVEETLEGRRVALLDFGIAGVDTKVSDLTLTGLIMGTPGYMSPEQARGDMDSVDRRSDIFALGIVLYELLDDQHPFLEASPSETSYAILHNEPKSLNNKNLPKDLMAIISNCLEKKPTHRYPSVKAIHNDIQAYLNGENISVRTLSFSKKWKRRILKRPLISMIVALSFISIFLVTSISIWWSAEQSKKAREDIALVEEISARSQTMRDQIRLSYMRPAHNMEPQLAKAQQELSALKSRISQANTRSKTSLYASLGVSAQLIGLPQVAVELLKEAWSKGVRTPTVIAALFESYAVLYFTEVNKARLINDEETSQMAIKRAQELYLIPAQNILAHQDRDANPLLLAYSSLLNNDFDQAIHYSQQAREQLDWPWPAWQVEAQAWANREQIAVTKGDLIAARTFHDNAYKALNQAGEFARSLPAIAARQCEMDSNLIYITGLHDLEDGVYSAPGCERLNVLSPGNEKYRALVAIAYEKAATRMLRFAKAPGYLLDKARELMRGGTLTTVDGFFARGLVDAIEGEQEYLISGGGSELLISAAKSYKEALKIDSNRMDIRQELSWSLTMAGVSSSAKGHDGSPYFEQSHAVWDKAMLQPEPSMVAVELRVVNMFEWAADAWAQGKSRESYIYELIETVKATVARHPNNKSFLYTLGSLESQLANEAFWRGNDPQTHVDNSLAAFSIYFEELSSFAAQDVLLATLINAAQYQHNRLKPYDKAELIQQKGLDMLNSDSGLVEMSLVLVKARLLQMEAEEQTITGESPIAKLAQVRELLFTIPSNDNSWPRALTAYARSLWFEYRWRFTHQQVDCKILTQQVSALNDAITGEIPQPFPRTYFIQLLHEIPAQHECLSHTELNSESIKKQWDILKIEHPIISSRIHL